MLETFHIKHLVLVNHVFPLSSSHRLNSGELFHAVVALCLVGAAGVSYFFWVDKVCLSHFYLKFNIQI